MVRVFEIPPHVFGVSGNGALDKQEIAFTRVHWFFDPGEETVEEWQRLVTELIQKQNYFDLTKTYLVLSETHAFVTGVAARFRMG